MQHINGEWIDSLPYVDTQYSEAGMKEYVDRLIKDEMKTFKPRDYLAHLPKPELKFADSVFLNEEMERIGRGEPMQQMDTTRYQLNGPDQAHWNDLHAWNSAVDNAKAQLEHQHLRLVNLELMQKYGANMWLKHNAHLTDLNSRFETQLSDIKSKITQVNRKRKADQVAVGGQLQQLEREFFETSAKTLAIEAECIAIEQHIKRHHGNSGNN